MNQCQSFNKEIFIKNLVNNHNWTEKEINCLRKMCLAEGYDCGGSLVFCSEVNIPNFLKKVKQNANQ